MDSLIFPIAPAVSAAALIAALILYRILLREDEGGVSLKEVAAQTMAGSRAYLAEQFRSGTIVAIVPALLLAALALFDLVNPFAPFALITGVFFSGLCGCLGMLVSARAAGRTASGAGNTPGRGLRIAYRAGAVLGLFFAGLCLIGISIWYAVLNFVYDNNLLNLSQSLALKTGLLSEAGAFDMNLVNLEAFRQAKLVEITVTMIAFGLGASLQALLAKTGGGLFSGAVARDADTGGKPENGIAAPDTRNNAAIGACVGAGAGEISGLGADLYESCGGSILAAAALGAALPLTGQANTGADISPMVVSALGIALSFAGMLLVSAKGSGSRAILVELCKGIWAGSLFLIVALGLLANAGLIMWGTFSASIAGLITGLIIGQATEYFTSGEYGPVKRIVRQSAAGAGSGLLEVLAAGMISSAIPGAALVACILVSYGATGGFGGEADSLSRGLYGIGIASAGMIATMAVILATSASGAIADNARRFTELGGGDDAMKAGTGVLRSPGRTTMATGRGYAVGAAALTSLALFAAYLQVIKIWVCRCALESGTGYFQIGTVRFYNNLAQEVLDPAGVLIREARLADFLRAYDISLMNPTVICGLLLGVMLVLVIGALAIKETGGAPAGITQDVQESGHPDGSHYLAGIVRGTRRRMMLQAAIIIGAPVATGLLLGVAGSVGMLAGALAGGFPIAAFFNNSGSAWDHARGHVGEQGVAGSESHGAGVIGDALGAVFRGSAGPSINSLIKIMPMVSIVSAGLIVKFAPVISRFPGFTR